MTEIVCDACLYKQEFPFNRPKDTACSQELEKAITEAGWKLGSVTVCPQCLSNWERQRNRCIKKGGAT